MSKLFESVRIGSLELKNRFMRSATWEGMAGEDGSTTKKLNSLMVKLAKNEVGLIITGHAYVAPEGQASPWQLGVHDDAMIPGLTKMTAKVHEAGGKICCQLAHGGMRSLEKVTGLKPMGPSAVDAQGKDRGCGEMTAEDIAAVVDAFGRGAARAKEAGFDAVQIHAAHGYLISQFLSGAFNLREDEYGGGRENRERLLMDVYAGVRAAVGDDFPVLVKINSHDYMYDKFNTVSPYGSEDMLSACARLTEAGVDAIEMSGGTPDSRRYKPIRMGMIKPGDEGYHRKGAKVYKDAGIAAPLALVGGIRSFEGAEAFVEEGLCDFISLCRPLIREPNLIRRWKDGDRAKAECMSDNLCFKPALAGEGLYCLLKKKQAARKRK